MQVRQMSFLPVRGVQIGAPSRNPLRHGGRGGVYRRERSGGGGKVEAVSRIARSHEGLSCEKNGKEPMRYRVG
jgi:hypothetical protein